MGFFDTDRWNEIWQTISRNRKRSIMTALGVFWGIFMLTVLLGAGMGLGRLFRAQLGDMSTNTLLIQPSQTSLPYKGMPKNRWWRMNNDDVENVRGLKEVQYASGVYWGGEIHCSYNERKGDYSLMGYMPDYQQINPQKIIYGRFINDVDMAQKRKVCVIGTQIQKDLFPGMEDPTGKVIKVNNSYFTIIGVMRRQSTAMSFSNVERTVVAPISLAQQMYGGGQLDPHAGHRRPGGHPEQRGRNRLQVGDLRQAPDLAGRRESRLVHGHGRDVRQGDEPLLGHRVPDMDRGPGDTAGRHRRRE